MDAKERRNEVEKRERLVQTFLIISGFLMAYTREEAKHFIVLIFSLYLIITILYYIFVSRTRNSYTVDYLAFYSSVIYSFLILAFLELHLTDGFGDWGLCFLLVVLTVIFTFSLLSPESSEKIVNWFDNFSKKQEKKYPKLQKVVFVIYIIIAIIMIGVMCCCLTML